MKVRFQADANNDIVTGVIRRVPEIDFKTAAQAELEGVSDETVLAIASAGKRLLVTHDRRTMPAHFAEFVLENECSGVLVISKRPEIGKAIDELILIWAAAEAEEFVNSIRFLPL